MHIRGWVKKFVFFFRKGKIAYIGSCIIYQNEAGPLWITNVLLNITLFLSICSFHFLVTSVMFASWNLFTATEGVIVRSHQFWWRGRENSNNEVTQRTVKRILQGMDRCSLSKVIVLWCRNVIHRGSASFLCRIHVPVLVIIPVIKKKALGFDSLSYIKYIWLVKK